MKLSLTVIAMLYVLYPQAQAVELRAGSALPSLYCSAGYERYTNSFLDLSVRGFFESSKKRNLDYHAFGLDVMMQTRLNREQKFSGRATFGGTIQKESEPWVYKEWPFKRKLNYGLVGEFSANWMMSSYFDLNLFAQQKLLFNRALGLTQFVCGLGLRYEFPHY